MALLVLLASPSPTPSRSASPTGSVSLSRSASLSGSASSSSSGSPLPSVSPFPSPSAPCASASDLCRFYSLDDTGTMWEYDLSSLCREAEDYQVGPPTHRFAAVAVPFTPDCIICCTPLLCALAVRPCCAPLLCTQLPVPSNSSSTLWFNLCGTNHYRCVPEWQDPDSVPAQLPHVHGMATLVGVCVPLSASCLCVVVCARVTSQLFTSEVWSMWAVWP
jgi:hypothetical protein